MAVGRNRGRVVVRPSAVRLVAAVAAGMVVASCSASGRATKTALPSAAPGVGSTAGAFRAVSYGGVQVEVPADWPVLGGNDAPVCPASSPTHPTVYLGIQPEAGIS